MSSITLDDLERELTLPTPEDVRLEMEYTQLRETCRQYNLTFTPEWLTIIGRVTLAQIVAAKISQRHGDAKRIEAEWQKMLAEEE